MSYNKNFKKSYFKRLILAGSLLAIIGVFTALSAAPVAAQSPTFKVDAAGQGKYVCGSGEDAVRISINIGCVQKGNAMVDAAFALLRFLSIGVGLVIIGSIVLGGVQYSASRGDPNATSQAIKRIRSSVYALFIFIFSAAILNFLIPQGFFKL